MTYIRWISIVKVLVIVFHLGIFATCATNKSSSITNENPIEPNANVNPQQHYEYEKIDKARRSELDERNKAFEVVPSEFSGVDFSNFRYINKFNSRPTEYIPLKNGEFEHEYRRNTGGVTYSLGTVYFLDLTGDDRKEAVVFMTAVDCGVSCDGGSTMIYFFEAAKSGPRFLSTIEAGSPAYGCAIKSIAIDQKKILLEQFGRCTKNSAALDSNDLSSCKFCTKDLTKSSYAFVNSVLQRQSVEIIESPQTNGINYIFEVTIAD